MTKAALDQFNDRPVKRDSGDVDILPRTCIDFGQRRAQRVHAHACAREIKRN
jgi:hypothetical protein